VTTRLRLDTCSSALKIAVLFGPSIVCDEDVGRHVKFREERGWHLFFFIARESLVVACSSQSYVQFNFFRPLYLHIMIVRIIKVEMVE
jgi:hypothetical protein